MDSISKIQAQEHLLHVSSSPHVRTPQSTQRIMLDVIIALLPAAVVSVVVFGLRALALIIVSVVACVAAEAITQKIRKRPLRIRDLSAVVTGILLAFNVPASMPFWQVAVAGFFAIIVGKELFGGIGENFINPALAGRMFLMSAWPASLNVLPFPFGVVPSDVPADAVSAATPLSGGGHPAFLDMFIGNMPGMLGEISALALLVGAAYLLWRGVIRLRIPAAILLSFVAFHAIFGLIDHTFVPSFVFKDLFVGGLMLGALFMATDYSSSPITAKGQLIYGIGIGLLTALIRHFGNMPEGVSYSIVLMNIATPLIDKFIKQKPYGGTAK